MNRHQKAALFMLTIVSISVILAALTVTVLYFKIGMPRALSGIGFLGLTGFAGLTPVIFRKDKGKKIFDERDKFIARRAALAGFAMSYLFVCLVCFIPDGDGTISVRWLRMIPVGAMIVMVFSQSLTLLIGYGLGGKKNE